MSDPREPDVVTVAVTRADGGLTVLRVITAEYEPDGEGGRRQRWTVDPTPAYIEMIISRHGWTGPLAPVSWRLVPDDFVDEATDRYFRNAWTDDGRRKPGVDMPKAREVHRDHLRRLRIPLLDALDIEYQRADETADLLEKQRIAARKQALRDVTDDPAIEAATTPEGLKAVIPEALR